MEKLRVKFSDLIREAAKSPADEFVFTPRAELTLQLAVKEASRLHHNFLSTAHLLLGLIELGHGVAFCLVQKMNLNIEVIRKAAGEEASREKDGSLRTFDATDVRCGSGIKKAAMLAQEEAKNLENGYVGTEHLLLALLRVGNNVDDCLFRRSGVDVMAMRRDILQEMQPNFGATKSGGLSTAASFCERFPWADPWLTGALRGTFSHGFPRPFNPESGR